MIKSRYRDHSSDVFRGVTHYLTFSDNIIVSVASSCHYHCLTIWISSFHLVVLGSLDILYNRDYKYMYLYSNL